MEIERRLAGLRGVYEVRASPLTGTVLVKYYDDEASPLAFAEELAAALESYDPELDHLSFTRAAQTPTQVRDPALGESLWVFFDRLDAEVRRASGGSGLNTIVPASLFAWGALS